MINSKNLKKNNCYIIDDANTVGNMSNVKKLTILINSNLTFLTFYVGNITHHVMVKPNRDNLIEIIKAPTQIQNINSQLTIRCSESIPFDFQIEL